MRLVIGIILATAVISCTKQKLNTGIVYKTKELKIEFYDWDDSRCPEGTNCVWEGEVNAFIKVTNASNQASDIKLHNIGFDTTIYNHTIKFVNLNPYPEEGKEIKFKDKELILEVTKL